MGTVWKVDVSGNATGNTFVATSTTAAGSPINIITTTNINAIVSPTAGMFAYDSTLNLVKYYNGSVWTTLQASGSLGTMAFENSNNVSITGGTANYGTAGSPPASAALSVTSTTQGFQLPNMTSTQRTAISSPATGLMVYDTTLNQAFGYNGTAWVIAW